jgi:DNA-binding MarR family transcriptional regulator
LRLPETSYKIHTMKERAESNEAEKILRDRKFRIWMHYHQTYNIIAKTEDDIFEELGITSPQYGILLALSKIKPPVTVNSLARFVQRPQNNVTMILDRMAKLGLIKRARNLKDRRATRVTLTDKGRDRFTESTRLLNQMVGRIGSKFSEEDWQFLSSLMEKISAALPRKVNDEIQERSQ